MAESDSTTIELEARKQKFLQTAAENIKEDFEAGIQFVADSGVLERAVNVGDRAPEFHLTSVTGEDVSLSGLLRQGPVILVWYRGGWCPYCNIYLHGLQKRLSEIEALGAQLVAISTELPKKSLVTKEKGMLNFRVLSDSEGRTAKNYKILYELPGFVVQHYNLAAKLTEYNGDDSYTLPLAASYVINTQGVVEYAYLDADYRNRAPIDDLIDAIR